MGQRPVDSDHGSGESKPLMESGNVVAEFAERLRQLRQQAGSPSFRELARRTHYSSSTLADATAGKRLPTEAVVKAFVTECGGDSDEWLARLRQAVETVRTTEGATAETAPAAATAPATATPPATEAAPARRSWARPLATVAAVAGILVIGGVAGGLIVRFSGPPADDATAAPFTSVPPTTPAGGIGDGVDPGVGGCTKDERLTDRSPVMIDGKQVGDLDLEYSPHCQAGWAKLFLYPGQPTMMGMTTVLANDGRASSIAEPLIKQLDIYTDVIGPGPHGCIGAQGEVLETGHPLVRAAITCQAPNATTPPAGQ